MLGRAVIVTPLLLLAACGGSATHEVSEGAWGGNNIALEVTSTGATVKFACGSGTLDAAIAPDAAGRFDVAGRYVFQGGPVPVGGFPSQTARYAGIVMGDTMTLTVTASGKDAGTFALGFGAAPHFTQVCAL